MKENGAEILTREALLNTKEAAAYLGLKPGTLEQWRWNGRGPRFVKLGRSAKYRMTELIEFCDCRLRTSTMASEERNIVNA